ncbi:PAS domain-containing sensor histidine kinase [Trinickia diaoshuihuensis]|uniref:PAS domain-containing sensor histidine kinase n=1 Tax=Trinickia diaoshuihuensis TaxID=2292265 RepID=UPI000E2599F9|nr:PAS domain-containing sensor histidine kinase [Trinickia diaoshuihuensis]
MSTPSPGRPAGTYDGWPIHSRYRTTVAGGLLLVVLVCLAALHNVREARRVSLAEGHRTVALIAHVLADRVGGVIDQMPAAGRNETDPPPGLDCAAALAPVGELARDEGLRVTLQGNGTHRDFRCWAGAALTEDALRDLETARLPVPGYPLEIDVGRPRRDILREWRANAWTTLVRTLGISSFVLVLLYAMVRQVRRQAFAASELAAGEQRWRAVFDEAPVGIVMLQPNQPYMVANPAFKRMVGYSIDELQQLGASDITHPDDIELMQAKIGALERGERSSVKFEKRYLHKDGRVIWTEITISRLSETGALNGMLVAVIDDVSARREAEVERLRLEAQLRQSQKLEALGTFAGGIAHDFNNILSAIVGYGERVLRALSADSPLRHDAQQVLNAGMRASLLVERILAFSRSGMTARLPVHVEQVLVETVELLKASLPPDVTLHLDLSAPQAYVLGDPTHLHQVVMNLCSNARHALHGQGTISVSAREVSPAQALALTSGTLQSGRYVRIGVTDTGAGISPEVQERMFDPFFTTRKAVGGTGLGLSLVDGIVKEYGGAIEVKSEIGRGTRFDIYLPLSAERPSAPPRRTIETQRGNGETILLVDDERALVQLCEDLLAELGYEPLGFSSPHEALEAFLSDPARFDLVLTDHSMPEMTGTELIAKIRAVRTDLPVLLMSGYGTAVAEQESRTLGVLAVLKKPVLLVDLAAAVRDAFRRSGSP